MRGDFGRDCVDNGFAPHRRGRQSARLHFMTAKGVAMGKGNNSQKNDKKNKKPKKDAKKPAAKPSGMR